MQSENTVDKNVESPKLQFKDPLLSNKKEAIEGGTQIDKNQGLKNLDKMPWPKATTPRVTREEQIEDTPQKYQKCEDQTYTEIALKITTQKSKN